MSSPEQRLNAYYCETCERYVVTVDRDEGVTPMMLACRADGDPTAPGFDGCKGTSRSMGYPKQPWPTEAPDPVPTWEWFTPEGEDYLALSDAMRDHVDRGGLDLRPIREAAS